MGQKKYTVYLKDEEAARLEIETTRQASPGKVIKDRLLEAWHKEDTAPVLPKSVQTDSIFTKEGDEIKRSVTDNDVSMFAESIAKPPTEGPKETKAKGPVSPEASMLASTHHIKVLQAISNKKEQRADQFVRADIVKASQVPGHVVDEVIKELLLEARIRKVGYNTYSWTVPLIDAKEREKRIEPIVNFLAQNNAKPN